MLILDTTPTQTGVSQIPSTIVNTEKARFFNVQMITTPLEGMLDSVTSAGRVFGSANGDDWIPIAKVKTSGTQTQNDGGPFEALWAFIQFKLEQTHENCNVKVYLTTREG